MKVLAGDIGGTNTRLALVEIDDTGDQILHQRTYDSRQYTGLATVVVKFLRELPARPGRACFGVAGPIEDSVSRLPNLGWIIEEPALAAEIGIPQTKLINDFSAVGHAIPFLRPADLAGLQPGRTRRHEPIAVIGAGTGLGQGFLMYTGNGYRVCVSEGGHADFAARNELECELRAYLHDRYGHVSCERVISGAGLVNIYRFLVHAGFAQEQPAVHAAMAKHDPAAVIAEHGLDNSDVLCVKALDLFASAYGAQAGNLALTVRAGAVYLAGGIAPKIIAKLKDGVFIRAFCDKGRFATMMSRIPVYTILNSQAGLIGAAAAAYRENLD